jgi:hypothetical protein
LALCLAHAVEEDKPVQSYIKGGKQLVVFDEVDVGLMVERRMGETRGLMGYVIRGANHKTYWEIHDEIRSAQTQPVPIDGAPATRFARSFVELIESGYGLDAEQSESRAL